MYAGFDLSQHRTFTVGSPSVQIDIRTVEEAEATGLSFAQKTNSEIAIGIRPDQLLGYTLNAAQLHSLGADAKAVSLLRLAVDLKPLPSSQMDEIPLERMRVVQTISTLSRDSSFRKAVLSSYNNTCAVSATQLQLVDAAHILPVGAKGSSDRIQNGVCLAPTYHRAYDLGIIYIDDRYVVKANSAKLDQLRLLRLDRGERQLVASLGPLSLPKLRDDWPSIDMIRQANAFRGIGL
jgi:putative restriction endonuclease